ncbi:MAG TPA: MlaD family protein [Candidatus Udaeobacter sp.]|jgi:phospholipid/cholesterol/gamma-HCH transport system substrate-binding protein|nr:MlaD family protein [Candidatus Udaeobacter sp.]
MNRHERGLEFKVGIFVFAGLAMLGALVVQFGRLGEGFKTYYTLTVRFDDAGGLLKGTDVLLAGARIGKVAGGPKLLGEGGGVAVPLKIYDYVKIPEGTKFTVGSSGLLGDRFVNVAVPSGQPKAYLPPNAFINGSRETGIGELTHEGGALVTDLRGTVHKIDTTVTRLNQETLSPQNMENLKASMEHLNQATASLAESSKKLDGVIDQADSAMVSAKKAADGLQTAIADTRKVLRSATQGKGLVATLLNDQQLANDLHALISNLRAHGVLFYRDSAAGGQAKPPDQTQPAHQGRSR